MYFFYLALFTNVFFFSNYSTVGDSAAFLILPTLFIIQTYVMLVWFLVFTNEKTVTNEELWLVIVSSFLYPFTASIMIFLWNIVLFFTLLLFSSMTVFFIIHFSISKKFTFWIWVLTLITVTLFITVCSSNTSFYLIYNQLSSYLNINIYFKAILHAFFTFIAAFTTCESIPLNVDQLDPDSSIRKKSTFFRIKEKMKP